MGVLKIRGRRFFTVSSHGHHIRDSYDYARLLQLSSGRRILHQIHAQILAAGLHQNPFLSAKLVSRYADLGSPSMADARNVFDLVPHRDAVLYNVIIRGYAAAAPPAEAVAIYAQMLSSGNIRPNFYTFTFVLKAIAAAGGWKVGRAVHSHVVKSGAGLDLFINNALIVFYAKCGRVETARKVFDEMPTRDLVSWNSMISAYAQNECAYKALELLHAMLPEKEPDYVTFVSALPACAAMAAVREGMWIHSYVLSSGIEVDAVLGSGLIEMYANCGRLSVARNVFDRITEKNVILCNSMIKALGIHGQASEALQVFEEMETVGIKPDSICFVSILSACSHAGMVEKGFEIFEKMDTKHGVEKLQVHYACMVDTLGRSGELTRATEFIEKMPLEPGRDVLGALFGACRAHDNVELGQEAARRLFLLDPENAGRYVAMAKMYQDSGRQEEMARMRKLMRDKGVRKLLGCSIVEVAAKAHTFGVEDGAHPMSNEIYAVLERLQKMVDEEENFSANKNSSHW
ncbi:Pentatricopeptide repeat-containing protein [Apostasia shenzhenica]|uniref:Pentatricopeptide repeat-containing protein n=1 Tax=Apostasia shenzhenica TaxID=1088818 RepID=A0A2I0BEX9_9ASPA|nr:Pentatricopeptide repeat-containing protein [Apostasia shenzhenica]